VYAREKGLCISYPLGLAHPLAWCSPSQLYAVAYRPTQAADGQRLEAWPEALAVGTALPTMPLWLSETLYLPLALEESYQATCTALGRSCTLIKPHTCRCAQNACCCT
jgi:hypothetical protein